MESVGLPAREGALWGIHVCLPVLERGEDAGQGHLVHSQLVAHSGPGTSFPHPYTDGKDTYFSASCQIFLLYFVFWQGILTGLPVFLNLVYPISPHNIIPASFLFP